MTETKAHSIFDTPPDLAVEAWLDAAAEADCTAGRVVPHEPVREWLEKLAKGGKGLPPVGRTGGVLYCDSWRSP